MIEWPWLMILLVLISTVQWPNSTAHQTKDNNSYWEGYLRSSTTNRPKRTSFFDQDSTATIAITSSYKEDQKNGPVINNKNSNVRDLPPANFTKSSFTSESTTDNSNKQPNTSEKSSKKKILPIVFPNPTVSINKFIPDLKVIEKCSLNETFCIRVDSYPREDLSNLFRTSKFKSTSYFGTDIVTNQIQTRISNSNLQTFCESVEDVIFPEAGITKTNEWRYIIQDLNIDNTNFKQGIRVEKCIGEVGTKCKFNDLLPLGYTSTCVQKFIYKKLIAVKDSKEVYYESFKLPSCCECMYSSNADVDPLTRFNQNQSETSKTNKDVLNKKN